MARARPGTPLTAADPSAISISSTAASSTWAAIRSALSRTACAARIAEPPPMTAWREAKAPRPNGVASVSPSTTRTLSSGTPSSPAASCAIVVSSPCPCEVTRARAVPRAPPPRPRADPAAPELRHLRLEPLPLRGDAGEHGDRARRIHPHRDALVAGAERHARPRRGRLAEPGQVVVDSEAEADVASLYPQPRLLGAEGRVVDRRHDLLEADGIGWGGVHEPAG